MQVMTDLHSFFSEILNYFMIFISLYHRHKSDLELCALEKHYKFSLSKHFWCIKQLTLVKSNTMRPSLNFRVKLTESLAMTALGVVSSGWRVNTPPA